MHDSATTMFMRSKMNGINGFSASYSMYTRIYVLHVLQTPVAKILRQTFPPGPKQVYDTYIFIYIQTAATYIT